MRQDSSHALRDCLSTYIPAYLIYVNNGKLQLSGYVRAPSPLPPRPSNTQCPLTPKP